MAISGLASWKGEILLFGKDAKGLSPTSLVREGVIQVPEGRQVFSSLTVEENLLLGSYCSKLHGEKRKETLKQVYSIFSRLAERKDQMAGSLSGGEQQMLALGRGLMGKPKLLLLDEPSLGLAPIIVEEIYQVLERLREERALTMVLVEQNALLALNFSHRAYLLESGVVIMQGEREELIQDDMVINAYLGGSTGFFDD
jgi:branched-chain amino acid transport system ATP-binding protein